MGHQSFRRETPQARERRLQKWFEQWHVGRYKTVVRAEKPHVLAERRKEFDAWRAHRQTLPSFKWKDKLDVNKGMATNWKRFFGHASDVYVPDGWVSSLSVDGRMIGFTYIEIHRSNRVRDGKYVGVTVRGTRDEALGKSGSRGGFEDPELFVLNVDDVLRPRPEEGVASNTQPVLEYLAERAVFKVRMSDLTRWAKAEHIVYNG